FPGEEKHRCAPKICAAPAALIISPAHDEQRRRARGGRRRPPGDRPQDTAVVLAVSARRAAFDAPKCHLFEPDCPLRCCAHEMWATAIGPRHGTNAYSQCGLTNRPARPSSCFCRKNGRPWRVRLDIGLVETKHVCRKAWLFAASAARVIPRPTGQM